MKDMEAGFAELVEMAPSLQGRDMEAMRICFYAGAAVQIGILIRSIAADPLASGTTLLRRVESDLRATQ